MSRWLLPLLKRLLWMVTALILASGIVMLPRGLSDVGRVSYYIDARRQQVGAPITYTLEAANSQVSAPAKFNATQYWKAYTGLWKNLSTDNVQAYMHQGTRLITVQVVSNVLERGGRSLRLVALAVLAGSLAGTLLGLLAYRLRVLRPVAGLSTLAAMTLSDYVLVQLGWLLTIWTYSKYGIQLYPILPTPDHPRAWVLPFFVLTIAPMGYMARTVFLAIEESMRADYIRTAKSIGHHEMRILFKHALKPALARILAGAPAILNVSLSGMVIVEMITGYQGLGELISHHQNIELLAVGVMYLAFWYVVLDTCLHYLRLWADPLLRVEVKA